MLVRCTIAYANLEMVSINRGGDAQLRLRHGRDLWTLGVVPRPTVHRVSRSYDQRFTVEKKAKVLFLNIALFSQSGHT